MLDQSAGGQTAWSIRVVQGSSGPQKVKPDRRDKNLRFRQILSRLSGLDPEKPNTRAKTSVF
ncbi:hypothetical protein BSP99_13160 [Corynebacterium glutamicum]|nr:hypothetical protein BSP99_13160 [Corynebacterium glutamicum]QWQ85178.1 hypothetical protein B5C28_12870 [Corynebacterium glutamicum]